MNTEPPQVNPQEEGLKQAGKIIQDIVSQLRNQPTFLFGIAVIILAILGLVSITLLPNTPQIIWFPFTVLAFGLFVIAINIRKVYSQQTTTSPPLVSPIRLAEPLLVTSSRPQSMSLISSRVLKEPKAGISLWIYLNPFERGIRVLQKTHRYILAHDTNNAKMRETNKHGQQYINSFAFCRGPRDWQVPGKPSWKIQLTNDRGEPWYTYLNDNEGLEPGWHHFLIRWDHGKPLIELLIDGDPLICEQRDHYLRHWPTKFNHTISVGGRGNKGHYVETGLFRVQPIYHFPNSQWVAQELTNKPTSSIH